jgi:hypothetical protein
MRGFTPGPERSTVSLVKWRPNVLRAMRAPARLNGHADRAVPLTINTREAVLVDGPSFLPESTGGEAWGCKNSREGGFQVFVVLASTVLRGNQKHGRAR